jgi:hypothetical protein
MSGDEHVENRGHVGGAQEVDDQLPLASTAHDIVGSEETQCVRHGGGLHLGSSSELEYWKATYPTELEEQPQPIGVSEQA